MRFHQLRHAIRITATAGQPRATPPVPQRAGKPAACKCTGFPRPRQSSSWQAGNRFHNTRGWHSGICRTGLAIGCTGPHGHAHTRVVGVERSDQSGRCRTRRARLCRAGGRSVRRQGRLRPRRCQKRWCRQSIQPTQPRRSAPGIGGCAHIRVQPVQSAPSAGALVAAGR